MAPSNQSWPKDASRLDILSRFLNPKDLYANETESQTGPGGNLTRRNPTKDAYNTFHYRPTFVDIHLHTSGFSKPMLTFVTLWHTDTTNF